MRPGSSLSMRAAGRASSSRRPHTNQRRLSDPRETEKNSAGTDWQTLRFQIAAVLFGVLWVVLWGRAFYVQIVMGPELAEQAMRQHTYTELVEARRGTIYDRNGQMLARSVQVRSVYANPREVRDPKHTALTLAPLLGLDAASLQKLLEKDRSFIWVRRKIDDATAEAVRNAALPGIGLSREYERVYPFKHLAGQLLGFVGLDNVGLEGLERSFNDFLAGTSQKNVVQRDGTGRGFYTDSSSAAQGKDLHLTLDVQIQFIAEEVIAEAVREAEAKWGGVLISDVESGEILAWAQYPFFNPNTFRLSTPAEYRNHLSADALEPGSTLKPFLMAAALEEKIVTPDTMFYCENGTWRTSKIVIGDDGRAYKDLPVSKLLTYSSNIGMAKLALEVGAQTYRTYLTRLGFGQRTGIGVGESRGILHPIQDWMEVNLMSAGFGQSLSVTGIQMLQAWTTLANGGIFRPLRLVQDESGLEHQASQRVFSTRTANEVMRMLIDVVDGDGTGTRARIPGIRVAGKTGTAQKADPHSKNGYGEKRLASFGGIVPADNPRYVIWVMLDEPTTVTYGGRLAAPVFQKVASRVLAYGGYLPGVVFATADGTSGASSSPRPVRPAKPAKVKAGTSPDVTGMSLRRAMERFAQAGVVPEVRGEGLIVFRQHPDPGEALKIKGAPLPCIVWMSQDAYEADVRKAEERRAGEQGNEQGADRARAEAAGTAVNAGTVAASAPQESVQTGKNSAVPSKKAEVAKKGTPPQSTQKKTGVTRKTTQTSARTGTATTAKTGTGSR